MSTMDNGNTAAFLQALPSYRKENFTQYNPVRKQTPKTYIATKDTSPPPEQVVTTDKTNILIRYLQKQAEATRNAAQLSESQKRPASPDVPGTSVKHMRTEA